MYKHILCPVDFSEYSRTALRYANAIARRMKGRLTVLFVNDPLLGAAAAAAAYDVRALEAKTDSELRRFIAKSIGLDASGVTITVALGHPAREIPKVAAKLGADLVVMGSRGLRGPGKWFFGSTTERVLRTAGAPMLVVPRSGQRLRARWAKAMRAWPGKTVIVPVDIHDYALADVRAAVEAVRSFGANPTLMHALPAVQFPAWLRVDTRTYDRDRIAVARVSLEKLASSIGGQVTCQVVVGDAAEEIAARAADSRAGLIVLTLKRATTPLGPRQGSITYRILSTETVPILAIPATRRRV